MTITIMMAGQKRVDFIRNMRAIGYLAIWCCRGGGWNGRVKRCSENSHQLTDWLIYIHFFAAPL